MSTIWEASWPLCVPVLSDGIVTLRAHVDADLDDVLAMSLDPATVQWTEVPQESTMDSTRHFVFDVIPRGWADGSNRGWAIEAHDPALGAGRFAGNIDIRGHGNADIGFALHPWARGRGLMHRAIRLAGEWAFGHADIDQIRWKSHAGNDSSWQVAAAAGFEFTGTVRAGITHRGQTYDAWTAVLLPLRRRSGLRLHAEPNNEHDQTGHGQTGPH